MNNFKKTLKMEKLRFTFTIIPGTDVKTNIYGITSIATSENKVYAVPEELQSITYHKELTKTPVFSKVKNSIKKRHQTRKVWITMTEELKKTYMDEDGNIQLEDQYLDEIDEEQTAAPQSRETEALEKLFEKLLQNTQEPKYNLKNIAEKFVIEKFSSKNTNAGRWIDTFEKECSRFNVVEDAKKIEILRLFMDKSCSDWYSSMIIKWTLDSEWAVWRRTFCESFINKGWNQATYALLFKYKDGSLIDYAIRKEKLLLEMRNSIDTGTLIDLIATGLPEHILNRIDREMLKETVDLFNELRKLEYFTNKNNLSATKKYVNVRGNSKNEGKNPCKICERLNKGVRYHPETYCWFKTVQDDKVKDRNIKHVNNSVIEAELQETEQKNF